MILRNSLAKTVIGRIWCVRKLMNQFLVYNLYRENTSNKNNFSKMKRELIFFAVLCRKLTKFKLMWVHAKNTFSTKNPSMIWFSFKVSIHKVSLKAIWSDRGGQTEKALKQKRVKPWGFLETRGLEAKKYLSDILGYKWEK